MSLYFHSLKKNKKKNICTHTLILMLLLKKKNNLKTSYESMWNIFKNLNYSRPYCFRLSFRLLNWKLVHRCGSNSDGKDYIPAEQYRPHSAPDTESPLQVSDGLRKELILERDTWSNTLSICYTSDHSQQCCKAQSDITSTTANVFHECCTWTSQLRTKTNSRSHAEC